MSYLSDILPYVSEGLENERRKSRYANDPVLWARDMLGVELWWKQQEVAYAIARGDKKSVAVKAGHGVGKSFLSAVLSVWWIDTHPLGTAFVATTAPSAAQVHAILWQEIRRLWTVSQKRHKEYREKMARGMDTGNLPDHAVPGYIRGDDSWVTDQGGVLLGQGRKPPDHASDAFQGIHRQYVLAIGDEAVGLSEGMIDSLSNITTNDTSRRLLIANPTNPNSRLGYIFSGNINPQTGETYGAAWSLHSISVLDSPNFHGGGKCECHTDEPLGMGMSKEALESLSGPSYVEEKRLEYGEDSPRFKSRVLGEFAFDEGNALFDELTLAHGMDAQVFVDPFDTHVALGVDVAYSATGDSTFVYKAETGFAYTLDSETSTPTTVSDVPALRLRRVDEFRGLPFRDRIERDGSVTVGQSTLIHQHALELGAKEIRVDASGLGIGLVEALVELSEHHTKYAVISILGGNPSPDSKKWQNVRAFQMQSMQKRMESGLIDIDREDGLLVEQLGDIMYELVEPHDSVKIESKRSMRKRGVKSPDAADASWYACADLTATLDALTGPEKGSLVMEDPWEIVADKYVRDGAGWPI